MIALTALVALTGCGFWPQAASDPENPARQAPDAELQPFYSQVLDWQSCGGRNQCAQLLVPQDYANPTGETVELALLRSPSTGPRPQGSLVVNPGGPGGSGVDFAAAAAGVASPALRSAFSIVGFDPRGVGRSDPLECLSDEQTDALMAADPSPDTSAEVAKIEEYSAALGAGCLRDDAALAAHVDSQTVARDMDVLRAALNEPTLNYLGFSYGTLLGALYAEAFPTRVGRFVLDGGIDPSLTNTQIAQGQAVGFEVALERFLADCVQRGSCPLGETVPQARATLDQLLEDIDAQPLPTDDPQRPLTQGLAVSGIVFPLYQPKFGWPLLSVNLRRALLGDGGGLLASADQYARRNSDGTYKDNGIDALNAVNCLDSTDRPDTSATAALASQWAADAPTFGPLLAYGNLVCHFWPIAPAGNPAPVSAQGAPPILVVGTEFDPATPYNWSQALASQLSSGVLVSWLGADGHTAYRNGSECIDDVVDAFLIEGIVPPDPTDCVD